MKRFPFGLVGLAALALAHALPAQTERRPPGDARLAAALRLAQDGLADSARTLVSAILAASGTTDPLYPEALFTAGLVAGSAAEAQRYYQRVAVEHSWSDYADDALLKLAQFEFAKSNPTATTRHVERIARDYPSSPVLAQAAYWGVRAAIATNDEAAACRWVQVGLDRVSTEDVETANQLAYFRGRCAGLAAPPSGDSTTPVPPAADTAPPAQPQAGPGYYVQVAAVSTQEAADKVLADLRGAGHRPITVREGGLLKVRVGPLADRAAADSAVNSIRATLGGSPFVVTVP